MRVNIYAEEMPATPRLEIIEKLIDGQQFTALRIYLELPASYYRTPDGDPMPASIKNTGEMCQLQAPFIHRPGDDDSAAVTFWGKRDLRITLRAALALLDAHYAKSEI